MAGRFKRKIFRDIICKRIPSQEKTGHMPIFFLTPASIGYLTQFILSLAITVYLAHRLRKREQWIGHTLLLTCIFGFSSLFVGLLFLDAILLPAPRLFAVYLENTVLGVVLVLLLQFAYRFPSLLPRRKFESEVVLGLSLFYTLFEAQFAVYRFFLLLGQGIVDYRSPEADYALAAFFVWLPVVVVRQIVAADERPVLWLRKLWQPQGLGARGARTFSFVFILLLVLSIIAILEGLSLIPTNVYYVSLSLGILAATWLFATAYLNFLPENTSFLVKLSGVTLTLLLAVLGLVGWTVSPTYTAIFQPALSERQTLRFTPNALGGYDVAPIAFSFETELGERFVDNETRNWPVKFTFPFFAGTYSEIYITNYGVLSLGQALRTHNLQYNYQSFPGLFPLLMNLDPDSGGGVSARVEAERLIITWDRLTAVDYSGSSYTFQVVLHRNGIFDFSYYSFPSPLLFTPDTLPSTSPWLRGVTPGLAEPVELVEDLSQSSRIPPQGAIQDFHMDFRYHLHHLLAPVAGLMIGSSLLIIFGLPILVNVNLIKPLKALLAGIGRAEGGDLSVEMPVQYRDEIGSLTSSFNAMAAQVRLVVTELEQRVDERTQELQVAITGLKTEAGEREQVEKALRESELRYRAVSQTANDAIISADRDGNIVGWNRGAETIFGYPEAEVIDRPLLLLMPARFHAEHLAGMARVQSGGEKRVLGRTIEVQGLRKNGREFPLEMSLAEWQIGGGLFYTAILRDITERKQVEDELHRAKVALEWVNIELQTAFVREQQLARTDPLTEVYNRRYLFELAERAFEVAIRYQQTLSVIMFDLDHFKQVNDSFGHAVGDQILQKVVQTACAEVRSADVVGRYGGEEFVVVLPVTDAQQAYPLAERIRNGVAAIRLPTPKGDATVTLSIGIAEIIHSADGESADTMIQRADEALYAAKRAGRNCTVIAETR